MLTRIDCERLAAEAEALLGRVGIQVENEELAGLCMQRGCRSAADGRLRIPAELIRDLAAAQQPTQAEYERNHALIYRCGPDWTHHLVWTRTAAMFRDTLPERFLMQAFDCGPTAYYDWPGTRVRPVDTEIFDTMLKFAEATPEIGYTSMWYRQEVPPMIERLDALRRSLPITGPVHVAGISNGGLSAFRIAGLYAPLFQSLTVLPGFPPTDEDRKNLTNLKHMRITMFVGETDQPWRDRSEETARTLRDIGANVQLTVVAGEGHFLRSLTGAGIAPLIEALTAARLTE